MNPTRTLALALAVSILAPALSAAAGLPTINPRLRVPDLNVGSYVKVPTFTTASLPKDFLDKSWLFGAMVEACTDNYLTLGEGAGPYKVRWTVEGDKALMVLDQRERVPSIGAGSQDVLNRYPMRENGDAVEIDLAHPEIMSLGLLVDRSGYSGVRPGYVYDLVTEPGYVSWGEKFVCQSTGGQDKPGQMTVAIKYFLKAATPSATFKPRVYPEQDTQRYGFFTTTIQQKQADGRWKAQDLADRWDLIDGKGTDLPGDLRCHVLYWVDYPTPYGNGAVGPSMSDPDTGEQLDGDVIFYADSYRDSIARLRHQAAAEHGKPSPEAGAADEKASPPAAGRQTVKPAQLLADKSSNPRRNRGFKLTCGSGPALTFTPTCERGSGEAERMSVLAHLDISTMTDEQVFTRMIQETVPHEIGHT
ncbi:MAG: hypothetical protein HY303_20570, partial [Candidatus Wallbacteria bacterium]|nr:hypothetical protein [Candidatus Wallbacteria bacterium]